MQTYDYRQDSKRGSQPEEKYDNPANDVDFDVDAELGSHKGITGKTPTTPEGWHKKFASEDGYFRNLKF